MVWSGWVVEGVVGLLEVEEEDEEVETVCAAAQRESRMAALKRARRGESGDGLRGTIGVRLTLQVYGKRMEDMESGIGRQVATPWGEPTPRICPVARMRFAEPVPFWLGQVLGLLAKTFSCFEGGPRLLLLDTRAAKRYLALGIPPETLYLLALVPVPKEICCRKAR